MKVLVVTGASGGHIYPALAFIDELKINERIKEILLVLPSRSRGLSFFEEKYQIRRISSAVVRLSLSKKGLLSLLSFLKEAYESLLIFFKFKPDVIVGFGSSDSVPLVMLGWFFRIKTIIHEQNVVPGRANSFLARFVDKIAVSYPQSFSYLKHYKDKLFLTGIPLRKTLKKIKKEEARKILGLAKDNFTVLVIGGSQGSRRLNSVVVDTLSSFENSNMQIIHLTGREDYEIVLESYKENKVNAKVFSFFEEMGLLYSSADFVICRAGAVTLAEIIYFKLPSLIVPYPYAYQHQFLNANILKQVGAAVLVEDSVFNKEYLATFLKESLLDTKKIEQMRKGFEKISFNTETSLLVELVVN